MTRKTEKLTEKNIHVMLAEQQYQNYLKKASLENCTEKEMLLSIVRSATRYLGLVNHVESENYHRTFWAYYYKKIAEFDKKEADLENCMEQEKLLNIVRCATRYLGLVNHPESESYNRVFWAYYYKRIAELGCKV